MLRKNKYDLKYFCEKKIVSIASTFFKVAMRVNLPWATQKLREWSKIPENHGFKWSKLWRNAVSHNLQSTLARLNGRKLCLYCQWVLWEGEPHEECDRYLGLEQDPMQGIQSVGYDYPEDPCKNTSGGQPDCQPEDPYENVPDDEKDDWEEEDEDSEWPDEEVDEEGSSLPPEHEPVYRVRICEGCGKRFETSNNSKRCYDCTLKEVCKGLPPEEGDYNTAAICSGSRQAQAVREELRDYI